MLPANRADLAAALRRYAAEYDKIASRAKNIADMTEKMRAAANEIETPTGDNP